LVENGVGQVNAPGRSVVQKPAVGASAGAGGDRRVAYWFSIVTLLGVWGVFWVCCVHPKLWDIFGLPTIRPIFSDTAAVLAASDARAAGLNPYANPSPFDTLGRPHVYGPWWLELHRLGLTRGDRPWIGLWLGVSASVVMLRWLRPRNWTGMAAAFLLMVSPPLLLAYERANADLVLFLLLSLAGGLLFKDGVRRSVLAAGLVWLAAALKIYPLVAVVALSARGGRWRGVAQGLVACVGFGVVWWCWRADFSQAMSGVPVPTTVTVYGLRVIVIAWEVLDPAQGWFLAGLIAGLAYWVWLAWGDDAKIPDEWGGLFVIGASCWVSCYLFTTNFAYRAVWLLLPAGVWLRVAQSGGSEARRGWLALAGLLALCWARSIHPHIAIIETLAKLRVVAVALGVENGLALGITVFLACAVLRLGWRRWRETAPARRI
jgi:hypothetical protein